MHLTLSFGNAVPVTPQWKSRSSYNPGREVKRRNARMKKIVFFIIKAEREQKKKTKNKKERWICLRLARLTVKISPFWIDPVRIDEARSETLCCRFGKGAGLIDRFITVTVPSTRFLTGITAVAARNKQLALSPYVVFESFSPRSMATANNKRK